MDVFDVLNDRKARLLPAAARVPSGASVGSAAMSAPLVRRSPAHTGEVVGATQLTSRMRRVTIRSDALVGVLLRPAQDLELLLREESGRRVKRRYTIRHHRPESGQADLDFALHGEGPGAAWGVAAAAGDRFEFQGPRGKLTLRPTAWHLLCGDESALPAISAIAEALPDSEPAIAVVEVTDAEDELPVRADVRWVHRGAATPGTPDLLVAAVSALDLPAGDGAAYLMGETRTMVAVRALLEGRGVAHDSIFVKGYWNIGRPDRITGQRPGA
jgi:NADPH-dependent ferric siderophore reductase